MRKLRARTLAVLQRLRYTEPAILRARTAQVFALLTTAGFTIPGVVDRWVGVALGVLFFLAPWYQGKRTRADVWSQQTVDELAQLAQDYPELALLARDLLGKGLSIGIVRNVLDVRAGDHRAPA